MPVPSTIADLTTSEATNSPADSETITATTRPSDYLRAHAAIIKTLAGSVTTDIAAAIATKQDADADLTAIAALAKTDGNIIVGNGSTWVAESGATARTSLGVVAASETVAGLVEIATQAEAEAGSSDSVVMTSLKTAQAIIAQKTTAMTALTASGVETSFTFGSIPSGLDSIKVVVDSLSTNGTNNIIIRLGTGGTPVTSGYSSVCSSTSNAVVPAVGSNDTGLLLSAATSTGADRNGVAELIRVSGNTWVMSYQGSETSSFSIQDSGAHITLGGALDTIVITTIAPGTNVFDSGTVNVIY